MYAAPYCLDSTNGSARQQFCHFLIAELRVGQSVSKSFADQSGARVIEGLLPRIAEHYHICILIRKPKPLTRLLRRFAPRNDKEEKTQQAKDLSSPQERRRYQRRERAQQAAPLRKEKRIVGRGSPTLHKP